MGRALCGLTVAALAVGGACSDGKAKDAANVPAKTSDTRASGEAPEGGTPGSTPTTAGKDTKGAPAKNGSSPTSSVPTRSPDSPPPSLPTDPSKPTLDLVVELKESCVRPGGTQSITIRTQPESGVGYDSVYADGKSGIMEGHYGGNNGGSVDDEGTYSDTWVISPNAPAGKVQVNVLGAKVGHNPGQTVVYFALADAAGRCS